MKITEATNEIMEKMKAVETGVHEAVEEFNGKVMSKPSDMKNKGFITIPSATAHKLFKMGVSGIDALTLYNFLQYTAIWQNDKHGTNNRPKATREYCKKGLHWGTKRYVEASRVLREMGLKRSRLHKVKGEVRGRYTELPFINLEKTSTEDVSRKDLRAKRPQLATNTDSRDILNTDVKNIYTHKSKSSSLNPIKGDTITGFLAEVVPPASLPKLVVKKGSVKIPTVDVDEEMSTINAESWDEYEKAMALTEEEARRISEELAKGVNGKGGIKVSPDVILERQASQFEYIQKDIMDGKSIPTMKYQFIARYKGFLRKADTWGGNVTNKRGFVFVEE